MLHSTLFSGLVLIVLLLVYAEVKNRTSFLKIIGIKLSSKNKKSTLALYNTNYFSHFKKSSMMHLFIGLAITLILAYILYNFMFFSVVLSNSMRPTFERGDMVLMQGYNTTPQVGDIIMFNVAKIGKDQVITHRIYSISKNSNTEKYQIKTKGDAADRIDDWTLIPRDVHSKAVVIGGEPIVIKTAGYYFLDDTPTTTYSGEFGFMQTIFMKAKEIGLLIFAICITLFILLSVNDSIKQKRLRRRN